MAKLAILGHATRGKEVIEILKMLGGSNPHNYCADCDSLCFTIGKGTNIIYYDWVRGCYEDGNTLVFTLEEFLEKFPYKVGDKVSSKYLKNYEISKMEWESVNNRVIYKLQGMGWYSADELQPYKEETMGKAVFDANAQCCDIMNHLIKKEIMGERKHADLRLDVDQEDKLATEATIDGDKITPPENYLIGKITKVDNGMLVEFVKKQPQYPKTYEECCEVLNIAYPYFDAVDNYISASTYKNELFGKLKKLLICRDAYWKIAGEEMGLGKPWKPDWREERYIIYRNQDDIIGGYREAGFVEHHIFEFPTKEMRDTFKENFKDLIESCKELL